jgi:cysteine desulfurase
VFRAVKSHVFSHECYDECVVRIYLDHNATAPLAPGVADAVAQALRETFGNASSVHAFGQRAKAALDEARGALATLVDADASEVVFTSGGTEADNLALKGIFWARRSADPARTRVLISAIEHHAVLDSAAWLGEREGATVETLPVDEYGRVPPETLRATIERDPGSVALVSVMWVNNEVGTVQPVDELAAIAREHGIPFHTDAVQATAQLPVRFTTDAMTITGHKIGGPVGVGALLLAKGLDPVPVLHGGGQERDVRSGTLDAPAIAGFAAAVSTAVSRRDREAVRLAALRDALISRVRAEVPDAILNGDPVDRLPGNAHFSFPGCEGDALLMLLDARGIECSTGSACSAGVAEPSHVLLAMGADLARARGSLRFSFGHTSTEADVEATAKEIAPVVERARRAGAV